MTNARRGRALSSGLENGGAPALSRPSASLSATNNIDTTVEPVTMPAKAANLPGELPILIGEFEANSRDLARVILENYRGHDLVYLSKWYRNRDGKLLPGAKSFAVNVRHLPRLKELVDLALARAIEVGLLPDGDGGKR
jgi:hypothetical protein